VIYQLPTGKVIELTIEQYLSMSDDDIANLLTFACFLEYNDPFTSSVIHHASSQTELKSDLENLGYESLSKEELEELDNSIIEGTSFNEELDCEDPD